MSRDLNGVQFLVARKFAALERLLHNEKVGGVVLLLAAAGALIWANSKFSSSYHAFWHLPLSISVGSLAFSQSLHFWVNDAVMTVFFLAVGMEIRREIHGGALSTARQAALPIAAALGGVVVPALIYLGLNSDVVRSKGWAVPTATDIAFAVGVLALLGRSIPANVRVLLLALAIIDDVIAVLIIAVFYAGGLDPVGVMVAVFGVLGVLGFQRLGVGTAYAYIVPGAIIWVGLLVTGAHPTLAGVVLGLMTPVKSMGKDEHPHEALSRVAEELRSEGTRDEHGAPLPLRRMRSAVRDILPPAERVHAALYLWVVYGVMPLFALANAGVSLGAVDLSAAASLRVLLGVTIALVIGKPLGIVCVSWLAVRLGWCRLPPGVSWSGMCLIGLLAGIGFTMSIFIAILAFADVQLLAAAKSGVLLGSVIAALVGLGWGWAYVSKLRAARNAVFRINLPPAG
jgi:NhaA family Na+:H+ antiporter